MKKNIFGKMLASTIVILFIGSNITPLASSLIMKNGSIDSSNGTVLKNNTGRKIILQTGPANYLPQTKRSYTASNALQNQRNLSRDRGYFYAYNAYDPNGMQNGPVTFNLDAVVQLLPWGGPSSWSGSDFDPDGNWYVVVNYGGLWERVASNDTWIFIRSTIPLNSLVIGTTTGIWYACGADPSGIDSLFTIDNTTGETTFVGHFGTPNIMISLMCDIDGNMYSYDVLFGGDSHLYSIDKTTGAATAVGDMEHDFCYAQEGKFDRNGGILYLAAYDIGLGQSYLATCDPATGAVTIINQFSPIGIEIDGFAIPYEVPDHYPITKFSWTPSTPLSGETILFNASASYDPDGYITLYEWDWNNDGVYEESHTAPTTTYSWDSPGSYKVTLRVTDNGSLTGQKSKTVEVITQPPEAPLLYGPDRGAEKVWYKFWINYIDNPDQDFLIVICDWGDGNISEWHDPLIPGQNISGSHEWTTLGVYAIRAMLVYQWGYHSPWSEPHYITIIENTPPNMPDIHGTTKGKPGENYLYTFVTTDPENDNVTYCINWGDSTPSGWFGPYPSGEQESTSHSWNQKGTYTVKVKAVDSWGAESDWGTLPVHIPFSHEMLRGFLLFEWLLEQFPHAFPILRYLCNLYNTIS